MTPLLVHGQSEPHVATAHSGAEEGSWRETKAQDKQRNAKTRSIKEKGGEVDSPGKALAGGNLHGPGKSLAGATFPTPVKRATLEPKVSNIINLIGTKAREAPPWWHADLCEDKGPARPR